MRIAVLARAASELLRGAAGQGRPRRGARRAGRAPGGAEATRGDRPDPDEELTLPITRCRRPGPRARRLRCSVSSVRHRGRRRSIAPWSGPTPWCSRFRTVWTGRRARDGARRSQSRARRRGYAALQLAGPGSSSAPVPRPDRVRRARRGASDRTARPRCRLRESGSSTRSRPTSTGCCGEVPVHHRIGAVTALARAGIGALRESAEGRALLAASCGEIAQWPRRRARPALRGRRGGLAQPHPAAGWRSSMAATSRRAGGSSRRARGTVVLRGRRAGGHPGAPSRHRVPVPAPADPAASPGEPSNP